METNRIKSGFEEYRSGKAQFSREFTFTGYDIAKDGEYMYFVQLLCICLPLNLKVRVRQGFLIYLNN